MITPRSTDSDFDGSGDHDSSPAPSLIADIQFWIDHPSLDDLTSAQTESNRQQVRRDVEECIRLLTQPTSRMNFNDGNHGRDSSPRQAPSQRYVVIKLLGVGAFGVVLQARDRTLNRDVAVKMLRPSVLISQRARSRFAVEGEALARCNCEGIVPIYEVDQVEGHPYLVMGLIKGMTLAQFVAKQQVPVSAQLAARIVAAIADAIHRAHQRGILHRDLKPSNVLLEQNGDTRLGLPFNLFVSDFGLAKDLLPDSCTNQGDESADSPIIGTVRYMSPEQATGKNSEVSVKSDVFSLGVILYELLTLQCPFTGATTYEVIRQVANSQPISLRKVNSTIPRELEAIVGRALSKLPSDRYQNAGELSDDLKRFLDRKPVIAKPAGPIKAAMFWVQRNPTLALTFAIIWLGLIVSTITFSLLYRENLKSLKIARDATVLEEQSRKFALKAIDSSFRYTAETILENVSQSNFKKLELHQKALEVNTEYAAIRGFDDESMYRLSVAHHLVANDAENCLKVELSDQHRKLCLEIVGILAADNPKVAKYQFDLYMNHFLLSPKKYTADEYVQFIEHARSHLLSAIDLSPGNPDYEDADAATCVKLGSLVSAKDLAKSRKWIGIAIEKSQDLGRKYPEKPRYLKHAIRGFQELARIETKEAQWENACNHCRQALAIIEGNYGKSSDVADIRMAYADSLELLSRALEHVDEVGAIKVYEQYAAATIEIEKLEAKFESYRLYRAEAYLGQVKLYYRLGKLAECRERLEKASSTLQGFEPVLGSYVEPLSNLQSEIIELSNLVKEI